MRGELPPPKPWVPEFKEIELPINNNRRVFLGEKDHIPHKPKKFEKMSQHDIYARNIYRLNKMHGMYPDAPWDFPYCQEPNPYEEPCPEYEEYLKSGKGKEMFSERDTSYDAPDKPQKEKLEWMDPKNYGYDKLQKGKWF